MAVAPVQGSQGHEPEEEEHAGRDWHENHVAVFVGATEAEELSTGEKDDPRFTLGLDYERRLSRRAGVGLLLEWVAEGERETILGIPVFLHAGRGAKFVLAPAVQRSRDHGETELVARFGFAYDFEVGRVTLAPALNLDLTESEEFVVLGVNVGWGF